MRTVWVCHCRLVDFRFFYKRRPHSHFSVGRCYSWWSFLWISIWSRILVCKLGYYSYILSQRETPQEWEVLYSITRKYFYSQAQEVLLIFCHFYDCDDRCYTFCSTRYCRYLHRPSPLRFGKLCQLYYRRPSISHRSTTRTTQRIYRQN